MKLHNKQTIMRAKEGKPTPEKKINIFRIIYYGLLLFLVGYVLFYFIMKQLVVKGEGFVVFDLVKIETPYSGKVLDLNESKRVTKGQFLCNIKERIKNSNIQKTQSNISSTPKYTQAYYKLLDLKAKYQVLKASYIQAKQAADKAKHKQESLRSLGLYNANESTYLSLEANAKQLKTQLDILKIQIAEYKKLPLIIPAKKITHQTNISLYKYIKYPIYSPITGDVIQHVNNDAVVKSGDLLFTIQTDKNLRIVAYFSQKYISDLKIGDEITVILPDDIEKQGKIQDISIDNSNISFKTLQKLKITIIPNDKDIKFWKKYNLLRLKVRKYKWH